MYFWWEGDLHQLKLTLSLKPFHLKLHHSVLIGEGENNYKSKLLERVCIVDSRFTTLLTSESVDC